MIAASGLGLLAQEAGQPGWFMRVGTIVVREAKRLFHKSNFSSENLRNSNSITPLNLQLEQASPYTDADVSN